MAKQTNPIDQIKQAAIIGLISEESLSSRLVLKGGNALELAYNITTRASFDLDFSIDGEFESAEWLKATVERGLKGAFAAIGMHPFEIDVEDRPPNLSNDVRDFWGGYLVTFKVVDSTVAGAVGDDIDELRKCAFRLGPNNSTVFRIDISRHESCSHHQRRRLKGAELLVYSPELIVCEKLRAICQQSSRYAPIVRRMNRPGAPRPRDFVDIVSIREWFPGIEWQSTGLFEILSASFRAKRVPIDLLLEIGESREFHRAGFESVKATVRPGVLLEPFDHYFDAVAGLAASLHALGHE